MLLDSNLISETLMTAEHNFFRCYRSHGTNDFHLNNVIYLLLSWYLTCN